MKARLIYHDETSIRGGPSPFAEVLSGILGRGEVRIACPYISVEYLSGLLAGCSSWRMLTDAEEFICINKGTARRAVVQFLCTHQAAVRHVKDLHAKVVVADGKAFVGSVNLTNKGLTSRDEMAVLFEGTEHVTELAEWFDDLWAVAGEMHPADLTRFVESIPRSLDAPDAPTFNLPSPARRVRASLQVPDLAFEEMLDARARLLKKLREAPHRVWADHYLDLVRELVDVTGLEDSDPRLVMSLPSGPELPVTICQRYVLSAFRNRKAVLSMMLPHEQALLDGLNVVRWGNGFRPRRNEPKARGPFCVSIEVPDPEGVPEAVKREWRKLVRNELRRGRYSSFKRHHEPIVFRAAVDPAFRRKLLDEAFPSPVGGTKP